MSRNGSGTYTLPAGNPVVTGTTITTTWANTTLNDVASSLTGSVAADGQTPMTGSLNMANNKIISVTDPTLAQDAATKNYTDTAIAAQATTDAGLYLSKTANLSDVASASTSRTNLGLGTIAMQAASAVAVTGGAIDGTTIGTTTRSTVKATTLDLGLSTQSVAIGQGNASIMKNRIINGLMQISQRGTSFTSVGNSGSTPSYTLDRWCGWRGGYAANLDVTQQTGWNAYQYSLRMQRTSGTSSTAAMQMAQVIESTNIYDLQGQNVTFSIGMRSGANYSGGQVTAYVQFSTAANQTSLALSAGTWTGVTSVTSSFTITSTGTQYSFSGAVPSGTLSMAVQLSWTPTGTAGTNDYIEFTGVQLEVGSSATGFEYRQYGTELSLCQRYYQNNGSNLIYNGTQFTSAWWVVQMRSNPTIVLSSGTINAQSLYGFNASSTVTSNFSVTASAEL